MKSTRKWEVFPWEPHEVGFCLRSLMNVPKEAIFLYGFEPHFSESLMCGKKVKGTEILKLYPEIGKLFMKEYIKRL